MAKLIRSTQKRLAEKRLNSALGDKFQATPTPIPAAQVGSERVMIRGQIYPGTIGDSLGSVVNVGRPGAAVYADATSGSAGAIFVVGSGSGGGSGGSDVSEVLNLLSLYLPLSGSSNMSGDLNMGGRNIVNVGLVDGMDVSAAASHAPATAGDGIAISGQQVSVDIAVPGGLGFNGGDLEVLDSIAGDGLGIASKSIYINLDSPSGLQVVAGKLAVGNGIVDTLGGLSITSKRIRVNAGAGLQITGANNLEVWAGNGLVHLAGQVKVGEGDGINATSTGVEVDVTDLIGAGLSEDASNNLTIGTPSTLYAGSTNSATGTTHSHAILTTYDASATFDRILQGGPSGQLGVARLTTPEITTNSGNLLLNPTVKTTTDKTISSSDWASGVTGWGITEPGAGDFRSLFADEMTVTRFIADLDLALLGSQTVGKSQIILSRDFVSPVTSTTIYGYDLGGSPDTRALESGDTLMFTFWERGTGFSTGKVYGVVSAYSDLPDGEQSWTFTRTSGTAGKTLYAGTVGFDYGVSGDGYWHVTTLEAESPFAEFVTWSGTPTNKTVKVRIGNLDGIADATVNPSGWGFYSDSAFLKGTLVAGGGNLYANADGLNLRAENSGSFTWLDTSNKLSFTTDPDGPAMNTLTGQMWGQRYSAFGHTYNLLQTQQVIGSTTGADNGQIWTSIVNDGGHGAYLLMNAGNDGTSTQNTIELRSSISGSSSRIIVGGDGVIMLGGSRLEPYSGNVDIGAYDAPFHALYVDTLFAGTTSSLDTGHNHNDLYYGKSTIDTMLAGYSLTGHTHAGYALAAVSLTAGNGLTGGGDWTANRTLAINLATASGLGFDGANKLQIKVGTALSVDGSGFLGVNASALAGVGLTEAAGTLSLNYGNGLEYVSGALRVKAGSGITVGAGGVALASTVADNTWAVTAGDGLGGGGTLSAAGIALAVNSTVARNTWAINAGTGLTGGGALAAAGITLAVNYGNGLEISGGLLRVKAGAGVTVGVDGVSINSDAVGSTRQVIAGAGLSGGGALTADVTVNVGAGAGITVNADTVAVNTAGIVDTNYGLTTSGNLARVAIATVSGLSFATGLLQLDDSVAGNGLSMAAKVLSVNVGSGLVISADTVTVDTTVARSTWSVATGNGLTGGGTLTSSGLTLAVDLTSTSGLIFSSGELTLGEPGELSATSTSATTALSHTHSIASSSAPGPNVSILATSADGGIYLDGGVLAVSGTHNAVWVNAGVPNGTAAMKVLSSVTDDTTLLIKKITGQTGRLFSLEDDAGNELIVISANGAWQSGNPGFVSGVAGWQISADGSIEANNITARGEIRTAVFVKDEIQVGAGSMLFAPAGLTKYAFTVTSGSLSLDMEDPPYAHEPFAQVGDILRIKSGGNIDYSTATVNVPVVPFWEFWSPQVGVQSGLFSADVWLLVTAVADMGTYYRFTVTRQAGSSTTFPASTTVVNYRQSGNGLISITSDGDKSPHLDVFTITSTPWNVGGIIPHIRLGRLDGIGLPELADEQYGILIATDATDSNTPRIVASNTQFTIRNVDLETYDSIGLKTFSVGSDGITKLGKDVNQDATTMFSFTPEYQSLILGNATHGRMVMEFDGLVEQDKGALFFQSLSVDFETTTSVRIRGILDVEDTGAIYAGSGSSTSPGTGILLNSTGLTGYFESGQAWQLDADGPLSFASNEVSIGEAGLVMRAVGTASDPNTRNQVLWRNNSSQNIAGIYGLTEDQTPDTRQLYLGSFNSGASYEESIITLEAKNGTLGRSLQVSSNVLGHTQKMLRAYSNSIEVSHMTTQGLWAVPVLAGNPAADASYGFFYVIGNTLKFIQPNGSVKTVTVT